MTNRNGSPRIGRKRCNDLGIARRVREAVKKNIPLTQAQMLGLVPMPRQNSLRDQDVHHR